MELAAGVARPRPQGTWPAVVTPVAQLTPLQDSAWGPGETWPPGRELSLSLGCVCVCACVCVHFIFVAAAAVVCQVLLRLLLRRVWK